MKRTSGSTLPYRCYFQQLRDGSWLGEDWRVLGISAIGHTFEECRGKLRQAILEDARNSLEGTGASPDAISLSALHEDRKSDEVIEFTVDVNRELAAARKRSRMSQA